MIDEDAARRVEAWIKAAIRAAQATGRRHAAAQHAAGGTAGKRAHDSDCIARQAFGPVACLESFEDFTDVLARVNEGDFGLQAGVFTGRLAHAMQAWDGLEVGGVNVGDIPSFRVDNMPYGGVKLSGLGREGVRHAITDMTEPRLLVIRG